MNWLAITIGVVAIVITAIDIFITVLYPRTGKSILSLPLSKGIWQIFRQVARWSKSDRILAYCGSITLVMIAVVWISLFIFGFALVNWHDERKSNPS